MNDIKPIWQRPSKEVEEDEYTAFYKSFSKVILVLSDIFTSLVYTINGSVNNVVRLLTA